MSAIRAFGLFPTDDDLARRSGREQLPLDDPRRPPPPRARRGRRAGGRA